jgi:hypothetical protein
MQVLHLGLPHIVWIKVIMWVLHIVPTWDCQVHHWCFILIQGVNILGYAQHGRIAIMD